VNSNFQGLLYLMVNGEVLKEMNPDKKRLIRNYATDNEIYTINSRDQTGCNEKKDADCTVIVTNKKNDTDPRNFIFNFIVG
jgi:hypothetical protein